MSRLPDCGLADGWIPGMDSLILCGFVKGYFFTTEARRHRGTLRVYKF